MWQSMVQQLHDSIQRLLGCRGRLDNPPHDAKNVIRLDGSTTLTMNDSAASTINRGLFAFVHDHSQLAPFDRRPDRRDIFVRRGHRNGASGSHSIRNLAVLINKSADF
jgi:hypothetical protein